MKTWTESQTIFQTDPFQIRIPERHQCLFEDQDISTDGFHTFRMMLAYGFNGIEGEMSWLRSIKEGSPWWDSDCLLLSVHPGRNYHESFLTLHFDYLSEWGFSIDEPVFALWNLTRPLGQANDSVFDEGYPKSRISYRNPVVFLNDGKAMDLLGCQKNPEKAWRTLKELFTLAFPFREITDPTTQIPGYKPEHHSVIFGE